MPSFPDAPALMLAFPAERVDVSVGTNPPHLEERWRELPEGFEVQASRLLQQRQEFRLLRRFLRDRGGIRMPPGIRQRQVPDRRMQRLALAQQCGKRRGDASCISP